MRVPVVLLIVALWATACAADDPSPIGGPIFDGTTPEGIVVEPPITTLPIPEVSAIRVPLDYFSVQDAVDAAEPGDLVLIDPGVYSEEVVVRSPDIVIRGRDRNTVFIDGVHEAATGFTVLADGVAIENLTVRNFTVDAISVDATGNPTPIDGFRILHVTTSNTGRHGIVARNASNVEIRQVWASGAAGAGISIENCAVCNTVIETSLAEFSARGISLTGTETAMTVLASTSRNNRVGIVVEDGPLASTTSVAIAGSVVLNNGFSNTPLADPSWDAAYGVGVHVVGTTGTRIESNRIAGNTRVAVLLGSATLGGEGTPVEWFAEGNVIADHPEGTIVPSADWVPGGATAIPYQNGPVPPGIEGMLDADSAIPVPAGPVGQPDLSNLEVPNA